MRSKASPLPMKRLAAMGLLIGCLAGVLLQAPASWLGQALARVSHQRMLLLNPQGTVWQGSADWALSDGDFSEVGQGERARNPQAMADLGSATGPSATRLPSRLQWQIRPHLDWSTFSIGLKLSLSSPCCTPLPWQVVATPTWQGLRVQSNDHSSVWPATWLMGLGAPWNTVQAQGQLQVRTQQLQWLQPWSSARMAPALTGQVELQWQQFSTRLSTLKPLGSYRVLVTGGDTMQVELTTLEGSLQLQGRGEWLQGRLRFRGEAKAQTDAEAALSNLLNVLGQRRGNVSFMELG